MAAFNINGKTVSVGDRVTVLGNIVSVSTSDITAAVVIQQPLNANTFSVNAPDVMVPATLTTEGAAKTGNKLAAGQDCSVSGLVTAISGSGNTATLTVTTSVNGTTISVISGGCQSDNV